MVALAVVVVAGAAVVAGAVGGMVAAVAEVAPGDPGAGLSLDAGVQATAVRVAARATARRARDAGTSMDESVPVTRASHQGHADSEARTWRPHEVH